MRPLLERNMQQRSGRQGSNTLDKTRRKRAFWYTSCGGLFNPTAHSAAWGFVTESNCLRLISLSLKLVNAVGIDYIANLHRACWC